MIDMCKYTTILYSNTTCNPEVDMAIFKRNEIHNNKSVWLEWRQYHNLYGIKSNGLIDVSIAGTILCFPSEVDFLNKNRDSWKFYLVTEGQGCFSLNSKEKKYFKAGDLLILSPHSNRNICFQIKSGFLKLLNFEVSDSPGIRHLCIRDVRTADVFRIANPSLLEEEYHRAINYLEHQDGNDDIHYLITSCAFTFLYKVQQLCFMENRHDSFSNIYLDINQFPEQNYSISALADQFHMSVRTFQRKFKRDMGCSMQSLVTTCRIGLARKLLQSTTLPISEISIRSGFYNRTQFSQVFKKIAGISPNEFRKSCYSAETHTNTTNLASGLKCKDTGGMNKLTDRQQQILWLLNEKRNISIKELARKLDINPSAVQKHLNNLKKRHFLLREGNPRGGSWKIIAVER